MKKFLTTIILAIIGLSAVAQAAGTSLDAAIRKYKSKNYVGCIQDTIELTQKDPANTIAYYYMAISYAQIGNKDNAVLAYQKVIDLSTNLTLVSYAKKGLSCATGADECKPKSAAAAALDADLDRFIKGGQFYSEDVNKKLQEIRNEQLKNNINNEVNQLEKSEMPTNDEIAVAVKTLAKAGFNPLQMQNNPVLQAQQAMYQNPEYAQLQMLLGNNSNNFDFTNMLPYFLAQKQGGNQNQNLSQDMVKNMMMSSMMGSLSTTFDMNDKN